MATVWRMHQSATDTNHEDSLLERAARAGFELVTRQTDTGQVVWEWCNELGPRPQFVSERVARYWMTDWLARAGADHPSRQYGLILPTGVPESKADS